MPGLFSAKEEKNELDKTCFTRDRMSAFQEHRGYGRKYLDYGFQHTTPHFNNTTDTRKVLVQTKN